jgi:hypothetical protein
MFGTAILLGILFAVSDRANQPVPSSALPVSKTALTPHTGSGGNLAPCAQVIVGFLVVGIGTSFGYNTGFVLLLSGAADSLSCLSRRLRHQSSARSGAAPAPCDGRLGLGGVPRLQRMVRRAALA